MVSGVHQQQLSFATFGESSALNTSYYDRSNAWVGPTIYGTGNATQPQLLDNDVELRKWKTDEVKPQMEILVNGLNVGYHDVEVYVSPTVSDIQTSPKLVASMPFFGFGGEKKVVDLTLNTNLSPTGTGKVRVLSKTVNYSSDWFGLSFFAITYPQFVDMDGGATATFKFPSTGQSSSLINVSGAAASSLVYDITDPFKPVLVNNSKFDAGTSILSCVVPRTSGKSLELVVVTPAYATPVLGTIKTVNFEPVFEKTNVSGRTSAGALNPAAFDYLILTNDDSNTDPAKRLKSGARAYAENYRSLPVGGNFRTLVMDMRTIYDQFNYGEPSPLAIGRFVDYMIQDGKNDKIF